MARGFVELGFQGAGFPARSDEPCIIPQALFEVSLRFVVLAIFHEMCGFLQLRRSLRADK